jgi:exosortase F-associated protein
MHNAMRLSKRQIFGALVLVLLLVGIRAGESSLFYDPLQMYFKGDFQNLPIPNIDSQQYLLHLVLRYVLTSLISLGILVLLFKNSPLLRFVAGLYAVLGVLLVVLFFGVLTYFGNTHKQELFYIRRFLIQPIFLLLFCPALYYQMKDKKSDGIV